MPALIPSSSSFNLEFIHDRNLIEELLQNQRSPNTQRTYQRALNHFFQAISGQTPSPALIAEFLQLERPTALKIVLNYKATLLKQGLAESTVNVRLSAIKSLVSYAQTIDKCVWSLEEIKLETVQTYRDTSGISPEEFNKLFEVCDRTAFKGKRDYAILRLLWDNVLRRGEIHRCQIQHFCAQTSTLKIYSKGKGNQQDKITLSPQATQAIAIWLEARSDNKTESLNPKDPLFIACDRAHFGHPLSGDGIYHLIRFQLAKKAGLSKRFSPHRCRHSGITALLIANNGNIAETQKVSRHGKVETVMIYNDNRANAQAKGTNLLANLIEG